MQDCLPDGAIQNSPDIRTHLVLFLHLFLWDMAATPASLLVIRLSSMGDVLLATPLLRMVRASYPTVRLDVVVDERFAEALLSNPHYSTLLVYARSTGTVSLLKTNDNHHSAKHNPEQKTSPALLPMYDVVIDLQRNRHSRRIRQMTAARTEVTLNKHRWQKLSAVYLPYQLYQRLVNVNTLAPIVERYRQTALRALPELSDDEKGLEFWLPEERLFPEAHSADCATSYPAEKSTQSFTMASAPAFARIAVAPGAHHATKRWLPERFAQAAWTLARRLLAAAESQPLPTVLEIVLLGGRADVEHCSHVEQALHTLQRMEQQPRQGSYITIRNASGSSSLTETARELSAALVLLCNDTGVMHLAAARHIPIVAVFGSTVQDFGFAPYRTPSVIVEAPRTGAYAVSCRPCTHIGRSSCPRQHFRCMTDVSAERVAHAAWSLLCSIANYPVQH